MELSAITEDFICSRIIFILSKNRIVLPHIFFTGELGIELKMINRWILQLSTNEQERYISIIEDEVLGTFFADRYPCQADDIQLDKVVMLTEGGVKSLIKYSLLKKRRIKKDDVNLLLQKMTNAFSKVQQNNWKSYTFDDRKYEDKQYNGEYMENQRVNVTVNNSSNVAINTTSGSNSGSAIVNENTNKYGKKRWKKLIGYTIACAFLCFFVYLFCREYRAMQDFMAVLKSEHWLKWLNCVTAIIVALISAFIKD